ncbi:hypothetical protein [Alkaliflexus imshenetskii]|uniref:hypothetical protein n=1 Tax=Alkaliflexus imshenetskii TaxID=286730 RepID=UPI00047BD512|nr:hypothetical protein [Alkaliflexus imshenetskii]
MIKRREIVVLIIAFSFLGTEVGKGVHFSFFHTEKESHQECGHDCMEEEASCPYENLQFLPFDLPSFSFRPYLCSKIESIALRLIETTKLYRITHYLLRGPPTLSSY